MKEAIRASLIAISVAAALTRVAEAAPNDGAVFTALVRSLANQNRPAAQFMLGSLYFSGVGIGQDYYEANKWFLKAAEQGDRNATYFLGITHARGLGPVHNQLQAAQWFQRAAEEGHS